MKVAIVGSGYVGLVTGTYFSELGHDVLCVDNNEDKIKKLKAGKVPIYEPGLEDMIRRNVDAGRLDFSTDIAKGVAHGEVIFIAVNTPRLPSGDANLKYVEQVAREIAQHMKSHKVIVEKSTVPVATGEKVEKTIAKYAPQGIEFDVVSNPEFLREGSALEDAMKPDRIVLGVNSKRAENVMRKLYAGINAPILVTDIKSAELIKHASNSFLALKISYINAISQICELSGANVEEVSRGMGLDKRIGPQFLRAGLGYGGSCFPKDVDAFEKIARSMGYEFNLLVEVQRINTLQKQRFIKRIKEAMWVLQEKKIGLLGLAFKPNTDDIREAPAADIIAELLAEGARVHAYDPKAAENMKRDFPGVVYENSPGACFQDADAVILVTEWDEFKTMDMKKAKDSMTYPLFFDGRNMFDPADMKNLGYDYHSVGR